MSGGPKFVIDGGVDSDGMPHVRLVAMDGQGEVAFEGLISLDGAELLSKVLADTSADMRRLVRAIAVRRQAGRVVS